MEKKNPLNELIELELLKTNNPSAVARRFGLNYQTMLMRHKKMQGRVGINETVVPEPEDIRELGKEGMKEFVVAIRRTSVGEWPSKFKDVIADARSKYDAGTHEMFTGRCNGWFVLYCQPRVFPVRRRTYFASMTPND
jgi:hypothetical protein